MRAAKPTKEMEDAELERLKHPEARPTTAYDPTELAALVEQTADDDLAVPIEPRIAVVPVRAPVGMRPLTRPQHPIYPATKRRGLVLALVVVVVAAIAAYATLLR